MGKTPRPIRILIHPSMDNWEIFKDLKAQGHQVHTIPEEGDPWSYDTIMGPSAWRMDEALALEAPRAIKSSREVATKRRYFKKEK